MFSTVGIAVADSMVEFLRLLRTASAGAGSFTNWSLDSNFPFVSKITSMVVTIVVPDPAIGTSNAVAGIKEIGGTEWIIGTLPYTVQFRIHQPLPELVVPIRVTAKSSPVKELSGVWWSSLLDYFSAPPPVEFRVGNVTT